MSSPPSTLSPGLPRPNPSQNCPAGEYQNQKASSTCVACEAGSYQSKNGSTTCDETSNGTYTSATGMQEALPCPAGTYSKVGSTSCSNCAPGTWSVAGSSTCTPCGVGEYTSPTGGCAPCAPGTFADEAGASVCAKCFDVLGAGYTSLEGAAKCEVATRLHYWDTKQDMPLECPIGAKCDVEGLTTETLEIEPGFSRLSTSTSKIYECATGNCLGTGNSTGNSSCTGDSACTCAEGSGGVLCAVCKRKHADQRY